LSAQRLAWSRRGGQARSNKARAKKSLPDALTPAALQSVLSAALTAVLKGTIEPGQATACANLARAITDIRRATELEQRLIALEEAASAATGRRFA